MLSERAKREFAWQKQRGGVERESVGWEDKVSGKATRGDNNLEGRVSWLPFSFYSTDTVHLRL